MSVGVASIDEQHKNLVGIINELYDQMMLGKDNEALGHIFNRIIDYAITHFKYEEELFAKTNYPLSRNHADEHTAFVKRIVEKQARFKSGEVVLSIEVIDFLEDWLSAHVLGLDKKYTAHFIAYGIR